MSEVYFGTIKTMFDVEMGEKIGYIITDSVSRIMLGRFFVIDSLVANKIAGIFDIEKLIDYTNIHNLSPESKRILSENEMMYIIEPTPNNMMHVEKQMSQFNLTVRFVFLSPIDPYVIERIAMLPNANLIKSVKSLPYNHEMFQYNTIISNTFPEMFKKGYLLDFPHISPLTSDIHHRVIFKETLLQNTEDIMKRSITGKYTTLYLSIPREYDLLTKYIIPWHYVSMISYYLRFDNGIVYDIDNSILLNTNIDINFNQFSNMSYDTISDTLVNKSKQLTMQSEEYKKIIQSGNATRDVTYDMIDNMNNLASINKHIKVLYKINSYIEKYDSLNMARMQHSIIHRDITPAEILRLLDEYIKKYNTNRVLRDVINIAYIANKNIISNQKYMNYIDPVLIDAYDTALLKMVSFFIKDNSRLNFNLNLKKDNLLDTFTSKSKANIKDHLNISPFGYTLYGTNIDNKLLSYSPMIKAIMIMIFDIMMNQTTSNYRFNPELFDLTMLQSSPVKFTSITDIVIHIDDYITHNEIRAVEELYNIMFKNSNKQLNIFFHSNSII